MILKWWRDRRARKTRTSLDNACERFNALRRDYADILTAELVSRGNDPYDAADRARWELTMAWPRATSRTHWIDTARANLGMRPKGTIR